MFDFQLYYDQNGVASVAFLNVMHLSNKSVIKEQILAMLKHTCCGICFLKSAGYSTDVERHGT